METISTVAVIGAGTMGAGIAQLAAVHGCNVHLIDVTTESVTRGYKEIADRLARSAQKGRITTEERDAIIARIQTGTTIVALPEVDLAIEAVVEDMDVKRKVFSALEQATRPGAILATNTSSLRVAEIAKSVRNVSRVVGMHFFNPAPIMPLVEIIAARQSSESALTAVAESARSWGKVTVRAQDTPGFIVNRVARGFYLEALRMLGEGVADIATIDNAMIRLGTFRMGPFQLMDLVGLDVNYAVSCSVYEQSGQPARLKPHPIQGELVEKRCIGRKAGQGFYKYDSDPPGVAVPCEVIAFAPGQDLAEAVNAFAKSAALCDAETLSVATDVEKYAFSRILATIMNEAAMTLEDGVASAEDIDIAMQRGTNYPNGPLAWAESTGSARVLAFLDTLNRTCNDDRFAPAVQFRT